MADTVVEHLQKTGIRRVGRAPRFSYRNSRGRTPSQETLARVRALRIPPGWAQVAINARERGRVQAVGLDAAGRWQYRYHPQYAARQSRLKFQKLVGFMRALPAVRRRVVRDLARRDLSPERVLGGIVRILLRCFLRPGSGVYAEENGSFGIVTLRRGHVSVSGSTVRFDFPGKSGKRQTREMTDRALARLMRELLRLPGRRVFKFRDADGALVAARRRHLNAHIKSLMGERYSAKDFRTWAGTLLCARALARADEGESGGQAAAIRAAVRETASYLGNTPAVCRASYVAPKLIESFKRGRPLRFPPARRDGKPVERFGPLSRFERALTSLLSSARAG